MMQPVILASWGIAVLSALGCAAAPSPATPAPAAVPASSLAALDSAMPEQLGGFARTEHRRLSPGQSDLIHRFRDTGGMMISVYLYPTDYPGSESKGDARTRVDHEGRLFLEVMPIQVRRGIYDAFEPLMARQDSAVVDGRVIPAFTSGVRVRRRGATMHEIQSLHLVGGDFVKLRSTITDLSALAALQAFDSALVQRLGRR